MYPFLFKLFLLLIQLSFRVAQEPIKARLDSIQFGVAEKDQSTLNYETIEYPIGLKQKIELDNRHKFGIRFSIRDESNDLSLQQVAIFFMYDNTNDVIVYFVDQDRVSKVYNKDINLAYKGGDFNYQSGDYTVKIVIGDTRIQPIDWEVGKINIQFNSQEPVTEPNWFERYLMKDEIIHQFKDAEKRPPVLVSHTFTLLSIAPFLILIYCWTRLGLNMNKFSFSFSSLLFHGSLALIFVLYTLFFIRLNMFTTLKCLSGVLMTAFISGHYLLKNLSK